MALARDFCKETTHGAFWFVHIFFFLGHVFIPEKGYSNCPTYIPGLGTEVFMQKNTRGGACWVKLSFLASNQLWATLQYFPYA